AVAFGSYPVPRAMSVAEIEATVDDFRRAAQRARAAGFQTVEVHGAHGYLLHSFCSPLSNRRTDAYGGSLANRIRLPLEVARAVRASWPADLRVLSRVSATDWAESGGWDLDQTIALCKALKDLGIDLVDCSSGGNWAAQKVPLMPGYQVRFAEAIRRECG